ncbi:MAG TPA: GvpL/GvpF family gas vesicle protein [Thermoanaerobaculia bacterium]|nr:GvpL/GvpF family gas vesicle protein [Thermoanaerobaculia bacterium]
MPRAKEPTGKKAAAPATRKPPRAKPAMPVKAAKSAKPAQPEATPSRKRAPRAAAAVEPQQPVSETLNGPGALAAARILAGEPVDSRYSEQSGKYVYCIIQTTEPLRFGRIGIGNEPADVHTVSFKDIAAVVSDTPLEVYDPTRENVLAHERVNEAVMRSYTVLPMSFSTVFKTREDIIELLRTAYDAFHDVLTKMQDKLEFGLKVLWEPELVIREIEKDDDNLRLLRQQISHQKGSTYFARMQYGRLVDSLLAERSETLVAEIFSALGAVSVASRANKPIGDKMILNAAFLVSRDRESDFDSKVKEIDAKYENLMFKYTGPWPPYNFVNIRLKLERATENR